MSAPLLQLKKIILFHLNNPTGATRWYPHYRDQYLRNKQELLLGKREITLDQMIMPKKIKNIALPSSPYFFFYDFSPLLFYSSNFTHYMTPTGRSRVLLVTSASIELNFIKIKHTFKISGKTRRVTVTQDFFCYALNHILITTDQSERFYFISNLILF